MSVQRSVTTATDGVLISMIKSATRRIILMAPGITDAVAAALSSKWKDLKPESVTVILDVSAAVLRFGYGDLTAIQLLESTAASFGATIDRQDGIRIGLLIADDETLVYAPTPRLIEAGPKSEEAPNAIRLGLPPADVERDLGAGPEGVKERCLGLDKAERIQIEQVEAELKTCPPQEFDVARQVLVFNAYFEFVELSLTGICIQRKTIRIPTDLLLALDETTQRKIHTTFRVIEPGDALSSKSLMDDRNRLVKRHLRHIPGHGAVIRRTAKEAFLKDFSTLQAQVTAFQQRVKETLAAKLAERQLSLENELLPVVIKQPPARWKTSMYFQPEKPDAVRALLHDELSRAFGTADDLVGEINAKVVFKAVTYESLRDAQFMELARIAFPELQNLYEERVAAPGFPATPVKA